MKIAFVMIVFQSDFFLEQCLQSVAPFGKVYAAEGPVKYWQDRGFAASTDRTNEILDNYRVETVHGQWAEKDDEANAALALVPDDVDYVWVLDSDEIWRGADVERVLRRLEDDEPDIVSFKPWSFYGGFDRYMTGFEENFDWRRILRFYPGASFATHRPPSIDPLPRRKFRRPLHVHNTDTAALGLRLYHYSYVFPSQIKAKTEYYHSWSKTIPDYFQRVYLPWVLGNETARRIIEDEFNGVHDWLPARRGACRTAAFEGEHPKAIRDTMPELLARFERELAQWAQPA